MQTFDKGIFLMMKDSCVD